MQITRQAIDRAARVFVTAWNNGNLERACDLYAPNAVFVAPKTDILLGRKAILRHYRSSRPDPAPATKEKLSLRLVQFRSPRKARGQMASAIFEWQTYGVDGVVTARGMEGIHSEKCIC